MCKVSDRIKFCTCSAESLPECNTWRLGNRTKFQYVGEIIPCFLRGSDYLQNAETILKRLGEKDCFDFDYTPSDNDVFIVKLKGEKGPVHYSFEFSNNQWRIDDSIDGDNGNAGQLIRQGEIKDL